MIMQGYEEKIIKALGYIITHEQNVVLWITSTLEASIYQTKNQPDFQELHVHHHQHLILSYQWIANEKKHQWCTQSVCFCSTKML